MSYLRRKRARRRSRHFRSDADDHARHVPRCPWRPESSRALRASCTSCARTPRKTGGRCQADRRRHAPRSARGSLCRGARARRDSVVVAIAEKEDVVVVARVRSARARSATGSSALRFEPREFVGDANAALEDVRATGGRTPRGRARGDTEAPHLHAARPFRSPRATRCAR